jgi:hypothetical protein
MGMCSFSTRSAALAELAYTLCSDCTSTCGIRSVDTELHHTYRGVSK